MENTRYKSVGKRKDDPIYHYACGMHCKLCPFPGFKCAGRPTLLNQGTRNSYFSKMFKDDESYMFSRKESITEIKKEAQIDVSKSNQNL